VEGEILFVDPRSGGSWSCVKEEEAPFLLCPGAFNSGCYCTENDPISCPIGECECEGQVRVNHDCTEARSCKKDGTYDSITCESTEIVKVNLGTLEWFCADNDDSCPGAFDVGCEADPTYSPAPTTTTTTTTTTAAATSSQDTSWCLNKAKNPLGTCEPCQQLWVNDDCTTGFFCDPAIAAEGDVDGCLLECNVEGEILFVDPRSGGSWSCVKEEEAPFLLCPGAFNSGCYCTENDPISCPIGECECAGQVRVNHDCTEARSCNKDGTYESITCESTEIVKVNLGTLEWFCADDDDSCPGAFDVGCEPDPTYSPAPATTTTTTTATTSAAMSNTVAGAFFMAILTINILFL